MKICTDPPMTVFMTEAQDAMTYLHLDRLNCVTYNQSSCTKTNYKCINNQCYRYWFSCRFIYERKTSIHIYEIIFPI